jgi:hypothetical protein
MIVPTICDDGTDHSNTKSWLSSENAKFFSRQNINLFVSHSLSLQSRNVSTCACHHQVLFFFSKPDLCNSMYCQIIVCSFPGSVAWCIAVYRLPRYLLGFHILLARRDRRSAIFWDFTHCRNVQLLPDVSGQLISPFFKGQEVKENWSNLFPETSLRK